MATKLRDRVSVRIDPCDWCVGYYRNVDYHFFVFLTVVVQVERHAK